MFHHKKSRPAQVQDRRAHDRHELYMEAQIETGGFLVTVVLMNITVNGFALRSPIALRSGQAIVVSSELADNATAEIIWSQDFKAGARFIHPLDESKLMAALMQCSSLMSEHEVDIVISRPVSLSSRDKPQC